MSKIEDAVLTNEALALMADPFAGDFGELGDRTLTDKIVTARKVYECHDCCSTINPGEKCRARTDVIDGSMMKYRWCHLCCAAMAVHDDNDGDAPDEWERRIAMGHDIRAQRCAAELGNEKNTVTRRYLGVPVAVMAAAERLCMPIDPDRLVGTGLGGMTAKLDAENAQTILSFLQSLPPAPAVPDGLIEELQRAIDTSDAYCDGVTVAVRRDVAEAVIKALNPEAPQ